MADVPAPPPLDAAGSPPVAGAGVPARRGFRLGLLPRFVFVLAVFVLSVVGVASWRIMIQQQEALDKEIRERGMALAGAVAATAREPLSLGKAETLQLIVLVSKVVQASDDPEAARRQLVSNATLAELVLDDLKSFGEVSTISGLRNEAVRFAKIVDPTGNILASADALKTVEAAFEEAGTPYKPPTRTQLLSPTDDGKIWESPDENGMYVIGVPIRQPGATEGVSPGPGAAQTGGYLGAVYLAMSQFIIRRAVAHAVAKLILVALLALVGGVVVAAWISTRLVRPIRRLVEGARAIAQGKLAVTVDVRRGDELGELAGAFNEMTKGLAEREVIRGAFGAYVSHDVLDSILANPETMKTIGGVRRTVTMLSTDIRGFTAMAGRLEAEEVVSVINAYLDVQARIIREHKGHVDKYVGDAVRAVFGIPAEQPDDAERAVRCAWAIRGAVARLVADRKARGVPAPLVGVGVDTGDVVAGNIGAASAKLEYTVIGDPVGTADQCVEVARDPTAQGGQVILTAHTYERVRHLVEVRELPPLELQGEVKELKIYEMTGIRDAVPAGR